MTKSDFIAGAVVRHQLIRVAENAIILFDAFDSMSRKYAGRDMSWNDIVKKVLPERNTYLLGTVGVNIAKVLKTESPGIKIVVLSLDDDIATAKTVIDDGAVGFILKGTAGEDFCCFARHSWL